MGLSKWNRGGKDGGMWSCGEYVYFNTADDFLCHLASASEAGNGASRCGASRTRTGSEGALPGWGCDDDLEDPGG